MDGFGAPFLGEFTAQESSQLLWACEKAGVGDEPLLAGAASERRVRRYAFPLLPRGGGGEGAEEGFVDVARGVARVRTST